MNDAGRAITYGLIDPPLGGPGPSVSFRRDSKGQSEMVLTVDGEVPDAKDGGGPAGTKYVFRRLWGYPRICMAALG